MTNLLFEGLCPCTCGCYITVDDPARSQAVCYACRSDNRTKAERGQHQADRVRADQVRLARRPLYGPNGQIVTDPSKFERP